MVVPGGYLGGIEGIAIFDTHGTTSNFRAWSFANLAEC